MRQALIIALALAGGSAATAAQDAAPPAETRTHEQSSPDDGLLRRLFSTLVQDVRRLPSKENRMVLVNGAVLAAAAYPLDGIATHGASSSKILKASFAGFGKAIGREWVQGGGALGAYVAGRLWNNPRIIAASGDLIEAQLVSVAVTQAAKFVVGRTRPDGEARSFPSGHASAAFATASTLQRHYGPRIAIPAYAIAVYTSASRLQANSHYASDVIAGAALGIAVGRTATIQIGDHRLQVAAAPVNRGVAVVVAAARD
jgi:hypothetical protein